MGHSCGLTCLKYTLFFINFVAWLVGIAIFGLAIWIVVDDSFQAYAEAMDFEHYNTACYILMAAGLLIIVTGFLGCCGAVTESTCMLTVYFVLLLLLFFLELTGAIYVLVVGVSYSSMDKWVEENLFKMIYNYDDPSVRWVMDDLQSELECCGVVDSLDYVNMNKPVPESCNDLYTGLVFTEGCEDAFIEYLASKSGLIAGLAIGVAILHISAMVMSFCLCVGLKKSAKGLDTAV